MKLSDLQEIAKNQILNTIQNNNKFNFCSINAAPGSGKTTLIINSLKEYFSKLYVKNDFSTHDNDGNLVYYCKGENDKILKEDIPLNKIKENTIFINENKKGLILSFNKKITDEAYKKASETKIDRIELSKNEKSNYLIKEDFMSKNLHISTYHGLFKKHSDSIIQKYNFIPDFSKSNFYKKDVELALSALKVNYNKNDVDYFTKLVNNYHNSPFSNIEFIHSLKLEKDKIRDFALFFKELMTTIYALMKVQEVTMPHCFYYKTTYEKAKKDNEFLKKIFSDEEGKPYSFIIVDEAQDSDYMIFDLIVRSGIKTIYVGDDFQNIYSFKGTFNIFGILKDKYKDKTLFFPLNESFRFGKAIGELVSRVPNILNKNIYNTNNKVIGVKNNDSIFPDAINLNQVINFCKNSNTNKSVAIITRTNKRSIEIFTALKSDIELSKKIKMDSSLKKDISEFLNKGIDCIKDITIKNELLNIFNNQKVSIIDIANNPDSINILKGSEYEYILKVKDEATLDALKTRQSSKANITITTVHQSKGLEYDEVIIADDYIKENDFQNEIDLINQYLNGFSLDEDEENNNINLSKDEVNVIFTVLSRAKENLIFMESKLFDILKEDIIKISKEINPSNIEITKKNLLKIETTQSDNNSKEKKKEIDNLFDMNF